MKIVKFLNYALVLGLVMFAAGCEEAYDPYPEFQSVPHGFGKYKTGTPTSLFFGNNNSKLEASLQWISTDGKVTVNDMDLFVTWTAADVYNAFKSAKFDYQDGAGSRDVFANPKDGRRSATSFFTPNDKFTLTWAFKSSDGKYYDSWSGGICSNSVGANCQLNFNIVCLSELAGTYDYKAKGWCGTEKTGKIEFKLKGTGVYEPFLDGAAEPDFSFGAYAACYGETAQLPGGELKLNDSCNKLFFSGKSRWGETYVFREIQINGANLFISWKNDYDPEAGEITITRTDGKPWPALVK